MSELLLAHSRQLRDVARPQTAGTMNWARHLGLALGAGNLLFIWQMISFT